MDMFLYVQVHLLVILQIRTKMNMHRCTHADDVIHSPATDLQVAVTCQNRLQCASKDREEEDSKLVNMNVNITGFKILDKSALQIR